MGSGVRSLNLKFDRNSLFRGSTGIYSLVLSFTSVAASCSTAALVGRHLQDGDVVGAPVVQVYGLFALAHIVLHQAPVVCRLEAFRDVL